jgi:2-oxo-4-hydroxy-4-carboxy-5-ureidoimidazoline decarboxylase
MAPAWGELCGSRRWASLMAAGAPYASRRQLHACCERAFDQLGREDWLEAFDAHSEIGAPRAGDSAGAREQAGLAGSEPSLVAELADAGAEYRRRFGFVFLLRASGRSGPEMLAALRARLQNPPEMEFANVCAQQREITALRLGDLRLEDVPL